MDDSGAFPVAHDPANAIFRLGNPAFYTRCFRNFPIWRREPENAVKLNDLNFLLKYDKYWNFDDTIRKFTFSAWISCIDCCNLLSDTHRETASKFLTSISEPRNPDDATTVARCVFVDVYERCSRCWENSRLTAVAAETHAPWMKIRTSEFFQQSMKNQKETLNSRQNFYLFFFLIYCIYRKIMIKIGRNITIVIK